MHIFQELRDKDVLQWEGIATRKDGSRYQELLQMSKLSDAHNIVQQYLLIRQDITSLKQYHLRLGIDAELPLILTNCQTEVCIYEESASYLKRTFAEIRRAGFRRIGGNKKKPPAGLATIWRFLQQPPIWNIRCSSTANPRPSAP